MSDAPTPGPGDFGPDGPAPSSAPPFSVAGPTQVAIDAARRGTGSFTVSNVTGRPVKARLIVRAGAGTEERWFSIVGEAERALPTAGTTTVDVTVAVPDDAPAGPGTFAIGAALEESPDQVVSGPTVAFTVPERARRRFPWWIVVVAAALLAAGAVLIWWLTREEPAPEPTPAETTGPPVIEHEVFAAYEFEAYGGLSYDLDAGRSVDAAVDVTGADLSFSGEFHSSGFLNAVGYFSARLAVVPDPTFEACEAATDYTQGQPLPIPADETTYVCVDLTDQQRRALLEVRPTEAGSGVHVIAATVWARGE
ncbi:hypothetical protein [Microbacterium lacusdiani]